VVAEEQGAPVGAGVAGVVVEVMAEITEPLVVGQPSPETTDAPWL
jgi:hypothetical protein